MDWMKNISFDKKNGEVLITGNRVVIITASALRAFRDTAAEIMKKETADSILYLSGKKHTKKFVSDIISESVFAGMARKFNWGKEKIIEKVVDILNQYGYGFAQIEKMDIGKAVIISLKNSCIATQYKEKQKETVCSYIAGLLAGGAEAITGKTYECFETHCMAKGDDVCRFSIEKS